MNNRQIILFGFWRLQFQNAWLGKPISAASDVRRRHPLGFVRWGLTILLWVGAVQTAVGGDDTRQKGDSPQWVLPSEADLVAGRHAVVRAMDQLEPLLESSGQAAAWKEYMLWSALADAISAEKTRRPDDRSQAIGNLLGVYNRLANDYPGLERQPVQALREALRRYVRMLNAVSNTAGPLEYPARMERIDQLGRQGRLTAAEESELTAHLRWLQDNFQALPAAGPRPRQANLQVSIGAPFIERATRTSVVQPDDIRECIVGTPIYGRGTTVGDGWLTTVPGSNPARLQAKFSGTVLSDTVGVSGPVRVYSDGTTALEGVAGIELSDSGLKVTDLSVSASSDAVTKGIATKFRGAIDRLVRRIAKKKVGETKSQANWESSRKAENKFAPEFREDVEKQLRDGNESLSRYLTLPLKRRDLTPDLWLWASDHAGLTTTVRGEGRQRPTAQQSPPQVTATSSDICVLVHQSFLDNLVEGYLGGRLQLLEDLIPSDGNDETESASDVAIRLSDFQPLRCVIDQGRVELNLWGQQFIAGGSEYTAAVIQLEFEIAQQEGKWVLQRHQAPRVLPVPTYGRRAGGRLKLLSMQRAIEPILEDEIPALIELDPNQLEGLELPEGIDEIEIRHLDAQDGWLQIHFRTS